MNAARQMESLAFAPRVLPQMIAVLACGGVIAIVVTFDPALTRSLARRLLGGWSVSSVPYLMSIAWILLAGAASALALNATRLFSQRDKVWIVLLFVPAQFVGVSIGTLEPTKIGLLIVLYGTLVDLLAGEREVRFFMPLLLMWIGILACAIASIVHGLVTSIVGLYAILAKAMMFFLLVNVVRREDLLRFALRLLVGLGIFSAIFALLQEALFFFFNIPLTLDPNAPKYWFKDTPFGVMIRASAFEPTSQNLAHSLLLASAFTLFAPFSARFKVFAVALMSTAMFFTFTGNAMLVLIAILLLAPLVKYPHRAIHYFIFVALALLACYELGVLDWVYEKVFLPISAKSAGDRVSLLQLGIEIVQRDPWLGIGLNNFGRVSPQPVHNAIMQLTTEIGVVGGALLTALLAIIFVRLVMAVSRQTDPVRKNIAKAVLVGFIALVAHFMFEPFINSMVSWAYIGLAEAAAMVLLATPDPTHRRLERPQGRAS